MLIQCYDLHKFGAVVYGAAELYWVIVRGVSNMHFNLIGMNIVGKILHFSV